MPAGGRDDLVHSAQQRGCLSAESSKCAHRSRTGRRLGAGVCSDHGMARLCVDRVCAPASANEIPGSAAVDRGAHQRAGIGNNVSAFRRPFARVAPLGPVGVVRYGRRTLAGLSKRRARRLGVVRHPGRGRLRPVYRRGARFDGHDGGGAVGAADVLARADRGAGSDYFH